MCSVEYTKIQDVMLPHMSDLKHARDSLYTNDWSADIVVMRTVVALLKAMRRYETEVLKCLEEM